MGTWVEALIDAPLCYLAFFAYLQGWSMRKPLEIVIATSHILGTIFFMGTELWNGLEVPPDHAEELPGHGHPLRLREGFPLRAEDGRDKRDRPDGLGPYLGRGSDRRPALLPGLLCLLAGLVH